MYKLEKGMIQFFHSLISKKNVVCHGVSSELSIVISFALQNSCSNLLNHAPIYKEKPFQFFSHSKFTIFFLK